MTYEIETKTSYLEKIKTWKQIGSIADYIHSGWEQKNRSAITDGIFTPSISLVVDTFDILHSAAVRLLSEAKFISPDSRRTLIVGVYSDEASKVRNEVSEALVPARFRAEALAGLSCVDHVVILDQANPLSLINYVRPNEYVVNKASIQIVYKTVEDESGSWLVNADFPLPAIPELYVLEEYGGKMVAITIAGPTEKEIKDRIRLSLGITSFVGKKD